MVLGLDLDSRGAAYALTQDGKTFQTGKVSLKEFPELLKSSQPQAIAAEYTGRIAEPWATVADKHKIPLYILHTVERKAINRLTRQRGKNNNRDAQGIARTLWLWHDQTRRETLGLPDDMFILASTVKIAWTLRAMLATVDTLTNERTKAKQRASAAANSGNIATETLWREAAKTELPERALAEAITFCEQHFPSELAALLSIPGVGPRCATYTIATLLPIARFQTAEKALAYIGLHANRQQSGPKDSDTSRPLLARTGHKQLRALLFIAALSQAQHDTSAGKLFRRLKSSGKPGKVALVAAAANLLRQIYAVLKRGHSREQTEAAIAAEAIAAPPGFIRQSEAAKILSISRQAIADRIKRGTLETVDRGGKKYVRIPEATLPEGRR